jgi:uncharacterized membrane protein YebE (DUF533 family)
MSFGNILGQLLEQGISGQSQTKARIGNSARNISKGGQGISEILGSLQSMLGGAPGARPGAPAQPAGMDEGRSTQGNPMGGLAEAAKAFLGQAQVGGMSGAQLGGLGAIAGALLGGGGGAMRGAAGGGAMAILGTLALAALQNARAGSQTAPDRQSPAGAAPLRADVAAVVSEEGERLAIRAMVAAAKADGQIDQAEMDRILGHLKADEITEAERRFVLEEIRRPLDPSDLAKDVRNPAQAAEVYAASLLAIDIDSEAEREYLRKLAMALRLDPGVVSFLHQSTGAPTT